MACLCPCGSSLEYRICCEPLHLYQTHATSAKTLMQSRFCAFYLKNIEYIISTTVPSQQALLNKPALQAWADDMTWTHLKIKSDIPKIGKRHAQVHFLAYFRDEQGEHCHDERSAFVRIDNRWYFLDPTVSCLLTNKQPCLCGSGEKFKACCGKFLV